MERLTAAQNAHDLEGMLACFHDDYRSEQPLFPARTFQGSGRGCPGNGFQDRRIRPLCHPSRGKPDGTIRPRVERWPSG